MTLPFSATQMHGFLMCADLKLSQRIVDLYPEEKTGHSLVSLFLGTLLPDNCSLAVRNAFVMGMLEAFEAAEIIPPGTANANPTEATPPAGGNK